MDGRKKIVYFIGFLILSLGTFTACKVSKSSGLSMYEVENPYTEIDLSNLGDTVQTKADTTLKIVPVNPQQVFIDSIVAVKKELKSLFSSQLDSIKTISKLLDAEINSKLVNLGSTQKGNINPALKIKNDSISLLKKQLKAVKTLKAATIQKDSVQKLALPKITSTVAKKDTVFVQLPQVKDVANIDSQKVNVKKSSDEKVDSAISKEKEIEYVRINRYLKLKTDSLSLLKRQLDILKSTPSSNGSTVTANPYQNTNSSDRINADKMKDLSNKVKQLELENASLKQSKPGTTTTTNNVYNQSPKTTAEIQQNQQNIAELTKALESLKSKSTNAEDVQIINRIVPVVVENEAKLNAKSDSIKLLSKQLEVLKVTKLIDESMNSNLKADRTIEGDSIQILLKKVADLKARKLANDSVKQELEQINKLNSQYKKAIDAKADSVELLATQLKSAKSNFENLELTTARDTILIVANYASGSIIASNKSEVLAEMKNALENNELVKVQLAGFTDISGSPKFNQRLSSLRVNQIKKDLISVGFNEKIIFTQAWGSKYASKVKNENERRVEILILVKKK